MDKNDITNDIIDLKELQSDLVALIQVVSMLELKYMDHYRIREPLNSSLLSLKSASVDFLSAADQMEGMANG